MSWIVYRRSAFRLNKVIREEVGCCWGLGFNVDVEGYFGWLEEECLGASYDEIVNLFYLSELGSLRSVRFCLCSNDDKLISFLWDSIRREVNDDDCLCVYTEYRLRPDLVFF